MLDKEFRIGGNSEYKNVCYTVSNEKDNQRLSVKYSYLQTTDNRTAFFNFSFYEMDGMTAKDGGFVREFYSDNRDASFVITDDLGNTIDFPKGDSYVFEGERTIYISYACAPEAIKNYFLNFSHENCYEYSFYINSVICAPD